MRLSAARRFRHRFSPPGDKSISHRLALFGALAHGETRIENYSTGADCASTLRCLADLGVAIERDGGSVRVKGAGLESFRAPRGPLDAGNSGTTLRMMSGPLAACRFRSVLTGDESLCRRPVERIAAPLRLMGARLASSDGKPPLTIDGGPLAAIRFESPVSSAQVKSAVLLAGLYAAGTTSVREPAASRDHTERLLPAFGASVRREGTTVSVEGGDGSRLRGIEMRVPGDVSSAAFFVVAALILPDSEVTIENVLLNPARTAFLDVLKAMGAEIEVTLDRSVPEPVGTIRARTSRLSGVAVDPRLVPALIDEVPALAVAGAHADGRFSVSDAAELRVKESDRIATLVEGLSRMGAAVEERPDGLVIEGGRRLKGATVRAHHDHRIGMALSIAALTADGATEIEGAETAAISFPEFYLHLARGVDA